MAMTLGARIQQLRKGVGLSQEQLGESLGVSRQAVSKWEMDQSTPDLEKLALLCRTFSVSADELLGLASQSAVREDTGGMERFVRLNFSRRLFTAGWVTAAVGAVLLVLELICLYPIRNAAVANALVRGTGYRPDLWYYASTFPMSAAFCVTGLVILAGAVLMVYALARRQE